MTMTSPSDTDQARRGTLFTTRLLWAAMLFGQIAFMTVIATMIMPNSKMSRGFDDSLVRTLFMISLGMLAGLVLIGYFVRMQVYKSGWEGSAVSPPAYLRGNLLLLGMMEGVSLLGLVTTMLAGSFFPAVLPSVVAMAVQVINFPTGRAMEPTDPHLGPRP